MKNGFIKNTISALATFSIVGLMPLYSSVYAEDSGISFKVSSKEEIVGNDVWVDVTSVGDVGFSSGRFCLHYNNEVLEYKGIDEGLMIPDSSDIKPDDISVTDDNQGVTYIVFTVEDITNADISFGFTAISAGSSEMTLEVNELFDQNDNSVNYTVDNGLVTIKEITTTETTTTSTETTTTTTTTLTETTTTTSSSSSSTSTSTETGTSASSSPSSEATTTSATTVSTETETSPQSSTQANQPSSTASNSQSSTATSSTSKTTTTTTKTTTTTTSNNKTNNNSGGADTGDRFPLAMLLTITGAAGVALVKTSPRKKDE